MYDNISFDTNSREACKPLFYMFLVATVSQLTRWAHLTDSAIHHASVKLAKKTKNIHFIGKAIWLNWAE